MVVILTWSGERKIYDLGLLIGSDGEPIFFETRALAEAWCNENDGAIDTYSKLVDLST